MKKPLIGIPAGEAQNRYYPNAPRMYGQRYTYVEAVENAGGTPLIIPILQDDAMLRQIYNLCDGILLAGGNDVDPASYKAKASTHTKHLHKERDAQELKLAEWAEIEDKPLLAICRGMQIINISKGGTLYQDIPTELPHAVVHEIPYETHPEHRLVHSLKLNPKSEISKILGVKNVKTNAYHHQAIKKLGKGLVATAWTPDDVIEAIEQPGRKFMLGVQSHPEDLESEIEPLWRKLFAAFVNAAKQ